ncbi:MAG: DUF5684 domain-containing protein [Candidatus Saccharibacteria bacterium]|nr:DUF5684 domain-containing protein [Candidatus Saccharibacteria bacterium]
MSTTIYYNTTTNFFTEILTLLLPLILVSLIALVIILFASWKIFEKAKLQGWKSLIPIYNNYLFFQICDLNPWFSLLLLIPLVNIGIFIYFALHLARAFGQKNGFAVGLILLYPLFLALLAFGKKYEYQYSKGKHIPFADAFRNPTVSELPSEAEVLAAPASSAADATPSASELDSVSAIEPAENTTPSASTSDSAPTVEPADTSVSQAASDRHPDSAV